MKNSYIIRLSVMMLLIFSANAAWCAEIQRKQPVASVSLGAEYSSGSYNSDSTTRTIYVPMIASWYPDERLDISVEVPFIYQSSSQVTTSLYQNSAATSNSQTLARRGGPGGIITGTTSSASSGSSSSVSGLGDIILRAGYILFFEKSSLPQLRSSLFVKTPTASVSDGLGTGEFDFGGGFDLTKWFGELHLAGELLYNYQGKVDGFGLKNYVSYTGMIGYQMTRYIQPMLIIKGATAPSTYSDDLLEARGRLLWDITPTTTIDLFASRGLSDSSPDYCGGIAVIYSF